MADFADAMTLGEARDRLRELVDKGEKCPCCTQFAKVYRRALPSASGKVLVALFRQGEGRDYTHLPTVLDQMKGTAHQGGYGTLSQFWGLIERQPGVRDDGSDRVGYWRLTDLGREFVLKRATVPKYARLYNGRCLSLVGDPIGIAECLGKKFDYAQLMAGL